jgi:hypothetical protein
VPTQPPSDPWIEAWLSTGRFGTYLSAAQGSRSLALALYEWNARLGAAFLHDLGHLEVGLRNAYDRVLSAIQSKSYRLMQMKFLEVRFNVRAWTLLGLGTPHRFLEK